MRYKNTKTRAIIDSPCKISGGDWMEIKEALEKTAEENRTVEENEEVTVEVTEEKEEEIEEIDGITKKEIMQELDAMGIEYNPRATKKELYDLMMQGR